METHGHQTSTDKAKLLVPENEGALLNNWKAKKYKICEMPFDKNANALFLEKKKAKCVQINSMRAT